MRSAAPLSIRHLPMIAAMAMTMPTPAAVLPNASATRPIFSAKAPGENTLTSIAAVIKAMNALTRSTIIMPMTVTMPITRMTSGSVISSIRGLTISYWVQRTFAFRGPRI